MRCCASSAGMANAQKPEDYLRAFSAFIRSNSNTIPALITVLTRSAWS